MLSFRRYGVRTPGLTSSGVGGDPSGVPANANEYAPTRPEQGPVVSLGAVPRQLRITRGERRQRPASVPG